MATLTAKGRKRMAAKQFALPGKRYPINNASHARAALSRVAQHGTASERATVRRKVRARYPGMAVGGAKRKRGTGK